MRCKRPFKLTRACRTARALPQTAPLKVYFKICHIFFMYMYFIDLLNFKNMLLFFQTFGWLLRRNCLLVTIPTVLWHHNQTVREKIARETPNTGA